MKKNKFIFRVIFDSKNRLVDKYTLRQKNITKVEKTVGLTEKVSILNDKDQLTVIYTNKTKIIFDKTSGLIKKIQNPPEIIPFSGSYINLLTQGKNTFSHAFLDNYNTGWKPKDFSYKTQENKVVFVIKGRNSKLKSIEFEISISSDEIIKTKYYVEKVPKEYIREMGIAYDLKYKIDSLSWKRDAYWSYYPFNHIGVSEGKISLYSNIENTYRKPPKKDWVFDTKSFYYDGTKNEEAGTQLTFIAKSTKENVITYNLYQRNQEILSVFGKGRTHSRITKPDNTITLLMNNVVDYSDLS